mmetsp:Transcript_30949/g.66912  ORF Transcript_30949/g.66912 Transcript_30949/m.66912 type:complete len:307 (-) Transcript_30949:637-1557(-)
MTSRPVPVQVLEGHLLDRRGLQTQILHGEYLRLRVVSLRRHLREVILAHQIHHIRREVRLPLVLQHVRRVLDHRRGNFGQHRIQSRNIVDELGELLVGVILRSEDVDATSLELVRIIDDAIDRLGDVVDPYGLGEGVSSVDEGHDGESRGHVGVPVEELVLVAEHLRGADDGGPGVGLQDGLFALVLGPGPLAGGVGVGGGAADVDEVIHLHFLAEFGDGLGDGDVGLGQAGVYLVMEVGELVRVLEGLGVVVLADEVDDDVGVGNEVGHGLAIAAGVELVFGAAELEDGAEVAVLEFIATGANVG